MASCAESSRTVTEHISIPCQIQGMVSPATNLLKMAHFLSMLGPLGRIMHQVLLSLQLLPLPLLNLCVFLLILKRKQLLGLLIILL